MPHIRAHKNHLFTYFMPFKMPFCRYSFIFVFNLYILFMLIIVMSFSSRQLVVFVGRKHHAKKMPQQLLHHDLEIVWLTTSWKKNIFKIKAQRDTFLHSQNSHGTVILCWNNINYILLSSPPFKNSILFPTSSFQYTTQTCRASFRYFPIKVIFKKKCASLTEIIFSD